MPANLEDLQIYVFIICGYGNSTGNSLETDSIDCENCICIPNFQAPMVQVQETHCNLTV